MDGELHVWTDHEDWVVALGATDAMAVMDETIGDSYEGRVGEWSVLPDDQVLPCQDENAEGGRYERTCGEWVTANGRGHIGSVNY